MSDLVVTVPMDFWTQWLDEGDLPGEPPGGAYDAYDFSVGRGGRPPISPGERVYVVAHGRIRGYAPLVDVTRLEDGRWSLVRQGGAVAITTDEQVRGFQGYRARWWDRAVERPFPDWQTEGVILPCDKCERKRPVVAFRREPYSGNREVWCWACLAASVELARAAGRQIPQWALDGELRGLAMVAAEEQALARRATP